MVIVDHGQIVAEGTPRASSDGLPATPSSSPSGTTTARRADAGPGLLGAAALRTGDLGPGDQLRLYVEDGSAALPELLRLLDSERIGIASMSLSEPTLDDVFLRQTGRSLRDTGPADGPEPTEVAA